MFFNIQEHRLKLSFSAILVGVIALSILMSISGPRMVGKKIDGNLSSTRITARFNQLLNPDAPLEIKTVPELKLHYTIQNNEVSVLFDEPLKTDQLYQISLGGVTDKRGKQSTATIVHTTLAQKIAYLRRDPEGGNDKIFRKTIGKNDEELLYESTRIGAFAITKDNSLAIVKESVEKPLESSLYLVKNGQETLLSPPKGTVTAIADSRKSNKLLLSTRDPATLQSFLFVYNLDSNSFTELTKNDGIPLHAVKAELTSDGNSIMYLDAGNSALVLLDPENKRSPINFGVALNYEQYLPDNKGIVYESVPGKYELIKSSGGSETVLNDITVSETKMLSNLTTLIYLKNDYTLTSPRLQLTKKAKEELTILADIDSRKSSILEFETSPNDEFISYQTGETPFIFDGYKINSVPKNIETKIITPRGELIDTFTGAAVKWL